MVSCTLVNVCFLWDLHSVYYECVTTNSHQFTPALCSAHIFGCAHEVNLVMNCSLSTSSQMEPS